MFFNVTTNLWLRSSGATPADLLTVLAGYVAFRFVLNP